MPLFTKDKSDDASITGAINGTNLVFNVSAAYTAGTLAVFMNGQEVQNQFSESAPATGEFTFDAGCAPKTGDTLQAHYFDTTADGVETVLRSPICAFVDQRKVCAEVGKRTVCAEVGRLPVCGIVERNTVCAEVGRLPVCAEVSCG